MLYSANIGDNFAMFEPAHGGAPKYKGLYKVNPTAMILQVLDARIFGRKGKGEAIFKATEKVIAERKKVTYDLGGCLYIGNGGSHSRRSEKALRDFMNYVDIS